MNGETRMTPPCPDSPRWRALLADEVPPDEQAELAGHLECCVGCRSAFDAIAAGAPVWEGARELADAFETEYHGDGETGVRGPSGLPFLEPGELTGRMIGRFGPYDVEGVVGRGGMGVVLKAFDPSLHRAVAVKVLAPQLSAGAGARRRFVREARAAASVAHEHVVTIHAVDEWKGWPYLVMQYVGGKSLQERIDRSGPLEVKEILRIGMQTAQGLAAAHAQGLVHRDIKPANILLENGVERVKLTDFGLARAVDDPSLTQAGIVAGTPQYMSPEQARGDMVDSRSDLFSLGSVMYAMATGRPPFRGDSTVGVIRKVCDETPRRVRESDPEFPAWLDGLIHKLLSKDPAYRFTSAAEVAEVLGDYLARLQRGEAIVEDVPAGLSGLHDVSDVGPVKLCLVEDVGPEKTVARSPIRAWRPAAAACMLGLIALGTTEVMGVTKVGELVATVLRIKVPEGTLVLEIDDPETKVAIDGGDVVIHGGGVREVRLKAGSHEVQALRNGQPGRVELVEVRRGDKQTLRVGLEPDQPIVLVRPEGFGRGMTIDPGPQFLARQLRVRAERESARAMAEAKSRESDLGEAKRELDRAKHLFSAGTMANGEIEGQKLRVIESLLASREAESRVAALRFGAQIADAISSAPRQDARDDASGRNAVTEQVAALIAELARLECRNAEQRKTLAVERRDLIAEQLESVRKRAAAGLATQLDMDEAAVSHEKAMHEVEAEVESLAHASERWARAREVQDRRDATLEELMEMLAEFQPLGVWPQPRFGGGGHGGEGRFRPWPDDFRRGRPGEGPPPFGPGGPEGDFFPPSAPPPMPERPGFPELEETIRELDGELDEIRKAAQTPESLIELRAVEETRQEIQRQLDELRSLPFPTEAPSPPKAPTPPEPVEPPVEKPVVNCTACLD